MFCCEFFEISKNTIFTEHVWATASSVDFSSAWVTSNMNFTALSQKLIELIFSASLYENFKYSCVKPRTCIVFWREY